MKVEIDLGLLEELTLGSIDAIAKAKDLLKQAKAQLCVVRFTLLDEPTGVYLMDLNDRPGCPWWDAPCSLHLLYSSGTAQAPKNILTTIQELNTLPAIDSYRCKAVEAHELEENYEKFFQGYVKHFQLNRKF